MPAFLLGTPLVPRNVHRRMVCTNRVVISMKLRRSGRYNETFRRDGRSYDPDPRSVPRFESPKAQSAEEGNVAGENELQGNNLEESLQTIDSGNGVPPGGKGDGDQGDGPNWGDESQEPEEQVTSGQAVRESVTDEQVKRLKEVYAMPILGGLARQWPALRYRLMANSRLPLQMGVELGIGFTTKTVAEVRGRKGRFWKEFDFYLSDIALELFGDAMLVWLLSPVALAGGPARALPRHAGQVGNFMLSERIVAFVWKGIQFGVVGFSSSMVGHGLTSWLVKVRNESGHKFGDVTLAPVIPNSLAWGSFLMVNSNSRYQLVNGIEQRVLDKVFGANAALLGLVTFALRATNSYVGSAWWLPWAKQWGLQ
ncbi:hypothetical protein FGB62_17g350 [Gracilaria domingensis]|nr:hypothetical protein FGB62_17g350 [Gracilaria domingensis]